MKTAPCFVACPAFIPAAFPGGRFIALHTGNSPSIQWWSARVVCPARPNGFVADNFIHDATIMQAGRLH
jgi:hypothetical protein